jgi:hypothetical protein
MGTDAPAPPDLGEWVRRRWRRGWKRLTVTRDGEPVAGIVSNLDHPFARPGWWSE